MQIKLTIISLCFILLFTGCNEPNKFFLNRESLLTYSLSSIDAKGNIKDCGKLKVNIEPSWKMWFAFDQTMSYQYKDCETGDSLYEITGFFLDEHNFDLHPPRLGSLYFTEILPFPSVSIPISIGNSKTSELTVAKSTFNQLNGKKVNTSLEVTDTFRVNYRNKSELVYRLKGENTNLIKELGQFHCEYLVSPQIGFIEMKFRKPDGTMLKLVLD